MPEQSRPPGDGPAADSLSAGRRSTDPQSTRAPAAATAAAIARLIAPGPAWIPGGGAAGLTLGVLTIAWTAVLVWSMKLPLESQRNLVFVGTPCLLLAGVHARTFAYLHAPQRAQSLPLPVAAETHFRSGHPAHCLGLVWTTVAAAAAVVVAGVVGSALAVAPAGPPAFGLERLAMAASSVACVIAASGCERWAVAAAAALGRRWPPGPVHDLQRSLSGGWTHPEATIHLYAPAFALGLAAALAMPFQLALDRWIDAVAEGSGGPGAGGLGRLLVVLGTAAVPALVALSGASRAPERVFGAGVFQAVPWLVEASKTLQGPPIPAEAWPRIAAVRDPVSRWVLLQWVRTTAVPGLRLAGLVLAALAQALEPLRGTATGLALLLAAIVAWSLPVQALRRGLLAQRALFAALPSGSAGPGVVGDHSPALVAALRSQRRLLVVPPLVTGLAAGLVAALAMGLSAGPL